MLILEDVGQQANKHKLKHDYFAEKGIERRIVPLPVGDYVAANAIALDVMIRKRDRGQDVRKIDFLGSYKVAVDTKKDIQELVGNICGKEHARFRDELILAQNNGIKLYILVANEGDIKSIDDLFRWHNPRLDIMKNSDDCIGFWRTGKPKYRKTRKYPTATKGVTLAKACLTMEKKYNVSFVFCSNSEQGKRVLELLGIEV